MRNTAVIHLPCNFCNVQLIVYYQFLYSFYFMSDNELLDPDDLNC